MSQKEFVSVALDSNILTMKEVGDMMKFYTDITLTSSLPFFQTPRFVSSLICQRFGEFRPPSGK